MGIKIIKKASLEAGVAKAAFAAKAYEAREWRTIPVEHMGKKCFLKKWQDFNVAQGSFATVFQEPCNVGILLERSGITDIDIDSNFAVPFLGWLPKTEAIWGRPNNPKSHYLYKGVRETKKFINSIGVILEIRSKGCYSVVPPSIHPDNEPYEWYSNGEPGTDDGLGRAVIKIAIAATLLAKWTLGCRHELSLAISGMLLTAGWDAIEVTDLVERVAHAAGDTEVDDRLKAVQTTDENLKNGKQTAGFSKLADVLGQQDAKAIASWAPSLTLGIGELACGAKSTKAKKSLADKLLADLVSRGVFYRTNGTLELLYFNRAERELYALQSLEFRALCGDMYGINGKEPVWKYIEERAIAYCSRHGEFTNFYQFARYQNKTLYVHAGSHYVFRLDGKSIETIDNGDDGILFRRDPTFSPVTPEFKFSGSPVRSSLVNVGNALNKDRLSLYEIFIYTLFFESLLPTKPIVLFTGAKGSGKTSAGRSLKRALMGPLANVDTGMANKEDAFWAGICHSSLVCIDNVDSLVPWLADALAVVSTGGTFRRRKLYETNTLVEYQPRCFIMLTSRNPQSVTRDDVVDRLLLVELERRKNFIEESYLLDKLDANRGKIWGELLTNLNRMVAQLKNPTTVSPLANRLADWTRLAIRFAPLLGITEIEKKLKAMEASKVEFALEDNPLVQGLEVWIAAHPKHAFIATGDLFLAITNIYESKGQSWEIKSARNFGIQLKNIRSELETRYKIAEKPGTSNKKLVCFTPLVVGVSLSP